MADKSHDKEGQGQSHSDMTQGEGSSGGGRRLDAADTRRYFDSYMRYRFDQAESPEDFAKRAGVSVEVVNDLFAQKQISEGDLDKVAQAINVSRGLLDEIVGYRPMPDLMRMTLERFFEAQQKDGAGRSGQSESGHGEHGKSEHGNKGKHAA